MKDEQKRFRKCLEGLSYAEFVEQLRAHVKAADEQGLEVGPETRRVLRWVEGNDPVRRDD